MDYLAQDVICHARCGCAASAAAIADDAGEIDRVHVRFDRNDELGRGASGGVYRGTWYGRRVAVKDMHHHDDDPRELREVVLRRQLSHPNIARIYGWCCDGSKTLVVMPLCEEGSLADVLRRAAGPQPVPTEGGPLGWGGFFAMASGIARALSHMASRSSPVVHHIVRPANILVQEGRPLLADFGTVEGANRNGSILYMAPEQCAGSLQTPATDIFAFGCVMWRLLMSPAAPRRGMTRCEIARGTPPSMTAIPADLSFIEQCFCHEPSARISADDLLLRLEAAAAARGIGTASAV